MRLKNKNVLVYGLGESGRAVVNLLKKYKAHISLYDDDIKMRDNPFFERQPEKQDYDLVVISPGIKCIDNPLLKVFETKKIPVMSELDFAYLHSRGRIVAITGTNGKTTVSMLVNKILKTAGYNTFLCGNIGLPFSAICEQTTKDSIIVCEVSNFQLETSKYFRPSIACILNIKPDHLDRHNTFEEYKRVKCKIAQNLKFKDVLILNLDDEETRNLKLHTKTQYFSKNKLKKGVFIWKSAIFINKNPILEVKDIPLKGAKNLENVLASVCISSNLKVKAEDIQNAVRDFSPASHRMEIVGNIDGVTYVDDSKATNVASTIACVDAFSDKQIFLLMGGKGKEINYDDFFGLGYPLKQVVCFGQESKKIFECAKNFGYSVEKFDKFDDAVEYCKKNASNGDFCILSPACSSFDEFSSYAERGEHFKELVLGYEI